MATVNFTDWAVPDLVLTLGGRTYTVPPPSVDRAKAVLACTVRAEINMGFAKGPMPEDLAELLVELDKEPLGHITLSKDVHELLVADGHPPITIDRVAYYAMFYWSRGKATADVIATAYWSGEASDGEGDSGDASGEADGR